MNNEAPQETTGTEEDTKLLRRRIFLQRMGKWSGAAIAAVVFAGTWLAISPEAKAGWINRRGYGGGVAGSTAEAVVVVAGSMEGEAVGLIAGGLAGRRPFTGHNCMPQEINRSLAILPAALAERADFCSLQAPVHPLTLSN